MWLRLGPHCHRCATPCAPAKRLVPRTASICTYRGTCREYSETRGPACSKVPLRDIEPSEAEGNSDMLSNIDPAKSMSQEKTVLSNAEMAMYRAAQDPSPVMANEKGLEEASNKHHEVFTRFLEQVEDDGYTAYAQESAYNATAQNIPWGSSVALESKLETKSDSTSMQSIPYIKANCERGAQDFADSLNRKFSLAALEQQVVENTNGYGIQKAATRSVTTGQDMNMPRRIDQSINICLHLDDGVTQEVDRIVTRFSQHRPILNNGRANIPVMKGLPAEHWRQYQMFMRFLRFWRPPFDMGRLKPLVKPLAERWGVVWQIDDTPAIQTIRQTFRQVLQCDLPQYNFPPDSPWESRATITKGISQAQADEIVDSINTLYPGGFDLGLITRCVLVHTLFSYGRTHTTVTQSPEFLLMDIQPVESAHDIDQRTQIESLWNETMSQIDNTFFKTSGSDDFYKTAPIRRIQKKKRRKTKNKNEQMPQEVLVQVHQNHESTSPP
ncbi:hypothetical protein DSL72_005007 [Monilinia vaccinii-corymbosi]|uniref:Uncharacterized protein n=1 Tax=Monilinia vaccinii-corymbosi TaxID=61207 RepID=A0A8A3PED9_9HELO|nr:hypothetical protein DSL72_005007 [Monilinia vaccinii-corymbosi]